MNEPFDIDADLVRKLSGLLYETGLGEIEYEDGDRSIRVARSPSVSAAPSPAAPGAANAISAPPEPSDASAHAGAIASPMVGTIYLSQSPGDPPLAKQGDTVSEGQTLMLIEAMKTFNEVKSPCAGTVMNIAVTSGQPVEYGELLAIVE